MLRLGWRPCEIFVRLALRWSWLEAPVGEVSPLLSEGCFSTAVAWADGRVRISFIFYKEQKHVRPGNERIKICRFSNYLLRIKQATDMERLSFILPLDWKLGLVCRSCADSCLTAAGDSVSWRQCDCLSSSSWWGSVRLLAFVTGRCRLPFIG